MTSKCSDQSARMRRLVWVLVGRTYHIFGNLMPRLMYINTLWQFTLFNRGSLRCLSNSYTMGCPPVRGDNPHALVSGLSYLQVDKHCITILYHLHQCRPCKVRKEANIRKRYNQVPHLTQDTTWVSNTNTVNITNKSLEVSKSRDISC